MLATIPKVFVNPAKDLPELTPPEINISKQSQKPMAQKARGKLDKRTGKGYKLLIIL